MGQFKDVGRADATLMEEMAEAIQVISKCIRFNGDWDEIPEGKSVSRWEELNAEMQDVLYQWDRLQKVKDSGSTLHSTSPELTCTCDEYDMCQQCCEEIKNECDLNAFESRSFE